MRDEPNVFGEHDEKTLAQFDDVSSRCEQSALMADGHLGYVMPIGGVAGYRNKVSVVGVGFDIACGNAAIRTDLTSMDLIGATRWEIERDPMLVSENARLNALADAIFDELSFGVGLSNTSGDAPGGHQLFASDAWDVVPLGHRASLRDRARNQLGTIGSGNHYVDVFVDETDAVWVGVHFGSRGFGHKVASAFLALSQGGEWGDRGKETEVLLDLDTPLGSDYWALMTLAGEYAYAGREWVCRKVVKMLGGTEVDLVHNHHNFAWKERHGSENLVVVRKGATPAWPGQRGFVGGSMGDNAVILQGAAHDPAQAAAMFSTVHGAGRVMGRMAAKGKWKKGRMVRPGRITHEMMRDWLAESGVVLRGADLDEAPQAYRRLPDVLAHQGSTVEVLHDLMPVVVCMAPGDTVDPYRD